MTPATTGSFIAPGHGWLSLSESGDTLDNTSVVVDDSGGSQVPTSVPTTAIAVYYFTETGTKLFARGTVGLSNNTIGVGTPNYVSFGANLDGIMLPVSMTESHQLAGHIEVSAAGAVDEGNPGDMGGNAGTPGCTSGGSNACNGYVTACEAGGIGPCYCAAACVCHYSCDPSCEQQNRANAATTNTTCSY